MNWNLENTNLLMTDLEFLAYILDKKREKKDKAISLFLL